MNIFLETNIISWGDRHRWTHAVNAESRDNATIIAYEKMNVYAYVSIIEAVGKLLIVYLLNILTFDKLEIYAVLMCIYYIIKELFVELIVILVLQNLLK